MTDPTIALDTIPGCVAELSECNREIAGFAAEWAAAAGELKRLEKREKRMYRAALRATKGQNADARAAEAQAGVEAAHNEAFPDEDPIYERIEELIGIVGQHATMFQAIDRRSSNAQSILTSHRRSAEFEQYVHPGAYQKPNT